MSMLLSILLQASDIADAAPAVSETQPSDAFSEAVSGISEPGTAQTLKSLLSEDTISHFVSSLVSFGFKLAIAIGVFILGKFVIRWAFRWIRRVMTHRGADPSLVTFLVSFVKITLYFILIITVIGILGVPTSSFLALFASAGVAIGLALSGTLQNFAGGVLILLLRPYKVGDFIEAQGYTGTVKEIQIFNTIINTPDNKTIIIPNGGLSTGTINNFSMESRRRVEWTVGVAYGTRFEDARNTLMELLESDGRILGDPRPAVFINELADSSVNLTVRAWVDNKDFWDVYFDMNERIYATLPLKGIEFPFPQLDVHLQNAPAN